VTESDGLEFAIPKGELKLDALFQELVKAFATMAKRYPTVSAAFWTGAAKELVNMAVDLTRVPLATVLVGAWKSHKRFAKYKDPAQFPPGKIGREPLVSHHITSTHHPSIDITVDGKSEGKIEFELELDLEVDTGTLVIENGRFMRIEGGRVKVTGKLKCDTVVVVEKSSRDFAWTDGWVLGGGAGIPISAVI
jgi:hypothetical protein